MISCGTQRVRTLRPAHHTLKTESCHNANFVVTGGTVSCHKDNLRCRQWRQSWHHDDSRFSVHRLQIGLALLLLLWLCPHSLIDSCDPLQTDAWSSMCFVELVYVINYLKAIFPVFQWSYLTLVQSLESPGRTTFLEWVTSMRCVIWSKMTVISTFQVRKNFLTFRGVSARKT